MNLFDSWAELDKYQYSLGKLSESQVKHFLQLNSPKMHDALIRTEAGNASRQDINLATKFLPYYVSHRRYEDIIRLYDKDLKFPDLDHSLCKFIGRGGGDSSLASYRKVLLTETNAIAFEKVYHISPFESHNGFKRTRWFYKQIFPRLDPSLGIPSILSIHKGKIFAAVYFDFIHNPKNFWEDNGNGPIHLAMGDRYACIHRAFVEASKYHKRKRYKHKYFYTSPYTQGRRMASHFLGSNCVSGALLDDLEQAIKLFTREHYHFAHGDLHTENFFLNALIDFDMCGWYPEGFDLAFMLSLAYEFKDKREMLNYVQNQQILHLELPAIKLSFLYFAFIFYSRRKRGINASDEFLLQIWSEACSLQASLKNS